MSNKDTIHGPQGRKIMREINLMVEGIEKDSDFGAVGDRLALKPVCLSYLSFKVQYQYQLSQGIFGIPYLALAGNSKPWTEKDFFLFFYFDDFKIRKRKTT